MSILRILSLKKMYGTTDFAIDRSTGQLYKMADLDVTPINLFGGIPDENLHKQVTEVPTEDTSGYVYTYYGNTQEYTN